MNPNFDNLLEELNYNHEALNDIVDTFKSEFLIMYNEYFLCIQNKDVDKFIFVLHKILNSIGLLNIEKELEICKKYYLEVKTTKQFYENETVNDIVKNIHQYLINYKS